MTNTTTPFVICTVSTVTRGQHMPDVLNALDVNVATIGNHDLGE
jgi:2',3'-cyclic-nucleotide 2'-phosphodiesterase (5'-nucleotidase family)